MGSRLSRLTGGNKPPDDKPKIQQLDELRGVPAEPVAADTSLPPAPAPSEPTSKYEFLAEGSEAYVPPPKRRTTPKIAKLRAQLRSKLVSQPDEFDAMSSTNPEHRKMVKTRLQTLLQRSNIQLSQDEYNELEEALIKDLLGFGAIDPLINDKSYSEVMVNGPEIIFGERKGKLQETEIVWDDDEHILWTSHRITRPMQRDFSRVNPMVDARLPDGSRVHLIMPPAALCGTTLTIRKFPEKRLTWQDLVSFGSFTEEVAMFLKGCVRIRLNIVVSGGTGSGKTTLLNVISGFIPEDERVVTIEDSAELQMSQRHVVRLETCPPMQGTKDGALIIRDLVKGSLRMRPDRIVVGEIRDGAAMDMLQAMNTGHDGSLTTVHSNSPRDAVARLETLAMMAGMDIPLEIVRAQIASAVDLFIQQARLKDGSRKIIQVTEVQGMEGQSLTLQDIFLYKTPGHTGMQPSHDGGGQLEPTGLRPNFYSRFEEHKIRMPASMFGGMGSFNRRT